MEKVKRVRNQHGEERKKSLQRKDEKSKTERPPVLKYFKENFFKKGSFSSQTCTFEI